MLSPLFLLYKPREGSAQGCITFGSLKSVLDGKKKKAGRRRKVASPEEERAYAASIALPRFLWRGFRRDRKKRGLLRPSNSPGEGDGPVARKEAGPCWRALGKLVSALRETVLKKKK